MLNGVHTQVVEEVSSFSWVPNSIEHEIKSPFCYGFAMVGGASSLTEVHHFTRVLGNVSGAHHHSVHSSDQTIFSNHHLQQLRLAMSHGPLGSDTSVDSQYLAFTYTSLGASENP